MHNIRQESIIISIFYNNKTRTLLQVYFEYKSKHNTDLHKKMT